jgi:predicted AAA+ superfamily ATPase
MSESSDRRLEAVLARLEALLPPASEVDWTAAAFRWRRRQFLGAGRGYLEAVRQVARIEPVDLQHVDAQKQSLFANTEQFVRGLPANNALLTGARGTGKSSLVRACLARFQNDGLRLIEVDKNDLVDLPDITALVAERPERFILFCDDLSFDEGESAYKALKAALDGSVAAPSENVLIYATSNRRHLMPEYLRENLEAKYQEDGEIHPGESVEEKTSLSERFGLWLSFYPFRQEHYLDIVSYWLRRLGVVDGLSDAARTEALQFALQRGSRSGRVALQFARDYAGRHRLRETRG